MTECHTKSLNATHGRPPRPQSSRRPNSTGVHPRNNFPGWDKERFDTGPFRSPLKTVRFGASGTEAPTPASYHQPQRIES